MLNVSWKPLTTLPKPNGRRTHSSAFVRITWRSWCESVVPIDRSGLRYLPKTLSAFASIFFLSAALSLP